VWDGSNWTQKSPQTSPPGRRNHAMAYDIGHSQVGFVRRSLEPVGQNDTWVWDGSNWTQKSPQTSPSARELPLTLYDSALGQAVLFGGSTTITKSSTTRGRGTAAIGFSNPRRIALPCVAVPPSRTILAAHKPFCSGTDRRDWPTPLLILGLMELVLLPSSPP